MIISQLRTPAISREKTSVSRRRLLGVVAGFFVTPSLLAQTPQPRRIGVLLGQSNDEFGRSLLAAFNEGLRDLGWTPGRNLELEHRWGEGRVEVMRQQAKDLLGRSPELIAITTATALREMQALTSSVPIIFWGVSDPVGNNFVKSVSRPGGNTTGFSLFPYQISGKWLQLAKDIAPRTERVLLLQNARNPNWRHWQNAFASRVAPMKLELRTVGVNEPADIELSIADFSRKPNGVVIPLPDPFFSTHRRELLKSIRAHRMVSVFGLSSFVREGGLVSYGIDQIDLSKRAAGYVSRVLSGEKPGDLPVQGPTKFELALNPATAKALGLSLSENILLSADELVG